MSVPPDPARQALVEKLDARTIGSECRACARMRESNEGVPRVVCEHRHDWLVGRVQRLASALDTALLTLDYMGQDKVSEHLRQAFYDETPAPAAPSECICVHYGRGFNETRVVNRDCPAHREDPPSPPLIEALEEAARLNARVPRDDQGAPIMGYIAKGEKHNSAWVEPWLADACAFVAALAAARGETRESQHGGDVARDRAHARYEDDPFDEHSGETREEPSE